MASRICVDLKWDSSEKGAVVSLKRGNGWTTQSLAYKSRDLRYVICNNTANDNAKNNIELVHKKGYVTISNAFSAGHANGACYCHENGYIYVLPAKHGASSEVKVYDPKNNYKYKFTIQLRTSKNNKVTIAGLAYDRITKQFYGASTNKICVFPYEPMSKGGICNKVKIFDKKFPPTSGYYQQDCGGHNGIIMCCQSKQHERSVGIYGYIDCYRASDGKYIKSYRTRGEVESVAVEGSGATGRLHVLWAKDRDIIRTKTIFNLVGAPYVFSGSGVGTVVKPSETELRNRVVKKAKAYKGFKETHFCKTYGAIGGTYSYDWCAAFVWTVFKECDLSDIMIKTAGVPTMRDWLKTNGIARSKKTAKGGDIAIYGGGQHVEIVAGKDSKGNLLTIGGNTGPSKYSGDNYHKDSSVSAARVREDPTAIYSPPYSKASTVDDSNGEGEVVNVGLETHPEQLYSSANYDYINNLTFEENESSKIQKEAIKNVISSAASFKSIPHDTSQNMAIITENIRSNSKLPKTKIEGEVHGPNLPIALNPVEAPFIELTIGDYTFGVKSEEENYPNYINGLSVVRTNGSMNEYTISLTHQISPGRNPNFIDELLAKNGYNKIGIKYGDANSNVIFTDNSALLTGATTNFDFASCNIKYTVKATSSVMSVATHKVNRESVTDKGSNIITNLLTSNTALSEVYPKMKDLNYVSLNNLIPKDDAIITIDAMDNINDFNYLKTIVAAMRSEANPNASYYLILADEYFKIFESAVDNAAYDAQLYEVNVNYPDDNQIFSFTNETDFTWPIAYEYGGNIVDYDYNITNRGDISYSKISSNNMLKNRSSMYTNTADNWWKQVTEFPTNAKLTCRGLLSPLLLMTYIKVNCYYFGSQRTTSGVYLVVGQEDSLDGGGYRTTLSLIKVAGPQQHLTVDARIKT